jgi:8-oxo-dGTP pyrophosphatase MutT (NUDIX family)
LIRHLTATAVILDRDRVLLLWHRKLQMWLPPGGHIEPNEDPEQAVRREVLEEVGMEVRIVSDERPTHPAVATVPPPYTIQVEDIPEGPSDPQHQHIDLIYVCVPGDMTESPETAEYEDWRWVPIDEVAALDIPPELPSLVEACADYATSLVATGAGRTVDG